MTVGVAWPRRLLIVTISTSASINWLTWVCRKAVKGEVREPRPRCPCGPQGAEVVGMLRTSVDVGKQQILVLQLPGPEPQPQLKLCLAMLAQHIDQEVGQGDCAAACCGLGGLEAKAMRFGDFNRLHHLYGLALKIDAAPAQRQHFAHAHAGKQ